MSNNCRAVSCKIICCATQKIVRKYLLGDAQVSPWHGRSSKKSVHYHISCIKWPSSWRLRMCARRRTSSALARHGPPLHSTSFLGVWCDAVCCSVLLCAAVCCSVLQHVLQRVAVWCSAMQYVVASPLLSFVPFRLMCYSVLQCVTVCCSVLQRVAVCWSVLQCVAVCCNVLQCGAVWCSVVQCGAVCCSVLPCVAVCCSVLQHVCRV